MGTETRLAKSKGFSVLSSMRFARALRKRYESRHAHFAPAEAKSRSYADSEALCEEVPVTAGVRGGCGQWV